MAETSVCQQYYEIFIVGVHQAVMFYIPINIIKYIANKVTCI